MNNIDVKTILEDKDLLVLEKPAGVLVHPTLAKEPDSLVSWLTEKYPKIKDLDWPDKSRLGVVHRLDKDTSGLVILAKNPEILRSLQDQFRRREIKKTYLALVLGSTGSKEGKIEASITRGKAGLQKVADYSYSFSKGTLRPAVTFYKTIQSYRFKDQDLTLVEAQPQTGRMHQIRVHLKHIGHPIIGDPLYNTKLSRKLSKELGIGRQFLHAQKLEFIHPATEKKMSFTSDLPKDIKNVITKLEEI